MSVPKSSSATPSRVSPVQWTRAFAYTPDSARVRKHGYHLHGPERVAVDSEDRAPRRNDDDDALPTRFHSRAQSRTASGVLTLDRDLLPPSGDGLEAHVPDSVTVPAKRKRQGRYGVAEALLSPDSPGHSAAVQLHEPSIHRRTRKTSSRCTSVHGHIQNPNLPRLSAPRTRLGSGRVVLKAVEIVSKKRSQDHMADSRTVCARLPAESAREEASSHYPSPPTSRAAVKVPDGNFDSHISHTVNMEDSSEPTLPLKISKYFASVSAPPTRAILEYLPVLTPPGSPTVTVPVYIESPDLECLPHVSFSKLVEGVVGEPSVPTWYNNPGLFDDLMIMLRRLKPILVQESVRDDPWKVLIAVRLLNVTTGKAAIPVFCKIISRWPTPQDLMHAPHNELVELLRPLGLYNKRASWLKDVSRHFVEDRQTPSLAVISPATLSPEGCNVPPALQLRYHGVGPYALDSLHIFCAGDKGAWKCVMPRDKELVRYLRWRWAAEEGKAWYPGGIGVIGDTDVPYLITLVDELAAHYDDAIGGEGYMYHFCNDLCDALTINNAVLSITTWPSGDNPIDIEKGWVCRVNEATSSLPVLFLLSIPMKQTVNNISGAIPPLPVFSQAVISKGNVYVSGSVGVDDDYIVVGGIQTQIRAALDNMKTVLEGAGSDLKHVLKVNVYLTHLVRDIHIFNDIYLEYFNDPDNMPARTCVGVAALPVGAFVEVECVAELVKDSN